MSVSLVVVHLPFRRAAVLPVVAVFTASHNLRTWGLLVLDLFKTGDGWVIV